MRYQSSEVDQERFEVLVLVRLMDYSDRKKQTKTKQGGH